MMKTRQESTGKTADTRDTKVISWLLAGDISIQYQVCRDLMGSDRPDLRKRIASEGWGRQFLACRNKDGTWGRGFYQPKWTCTHYTLLDLKNLGIMPDNTLVRDTLRKIFENEKGRDGGIRPIGTIQASDVCINGMVLNYASYFQVAEADMRSVVDFLLHERMNDGGFNCRSNREGADHSSLHTTLSVLEGILEYERNGYAYRLKELKRAQLDSHEFILAHRLFRSHRTGEIINANFLKLYYPGRWYYDILKVMDYFQMAEVRYDERMSDALEVIKSKKTADGRLKLPAKHPGQTHFEMEKAGQPSRWNTLRVMRVLKRYEGEQNR